MTHRCCMCSENVPYKLPLCGGPVLYGVFVKIYKCKINTNLIWWSCILIVYILETDVLFVDVFEKKFKVSIHKQWFFSPNISHSKEEAVVSF